MREWQVHNVAGLTATSPLPTSKASVAQTATMTTMTVRSSFLSFFLSFSSLSFFIPDVLTRFCGESRHAHLGRNIRWRERAGAHARLEEAMARVAFWC